MFSHLIRLFRCIQLDPHPPYVMRSSMFPLKIWKNPSFLLKMLKNSPMFPGLFSHSLQHRRAVVRCRCLQAANGAPSGARCCTPPLTVWPSPAPPLSLGRNVAGAIGKFPAIFCGTCFNGKCICLMGKSQSTIGLLNRKFIYEWEKHLQVAIHRKIPKSKSDLLNGNIIYE